MNCTDQNICFVLRGRPGLGHVLPGLAIAREFHRRGATVTILTYGNGISFLKNSPELANNFEIIEVDISEKYTDWPGLDLYEFGLNVLLPIVKERNSRFVFLGGEYLLAPLASVMLAKMCLIFNPEIMEDTPKNAIPSALFCHVFSPLKFLCPMGPLENSSNSIPEFSGMENRLTPPGPFLLKGSASEMSDSERLIVVGNGGGVSFPADTRSYSSHGVTTQQWLEQTLQMTIEATRAAQKYGGKNVKIIVYSALNESMNKCISEEFNDDAISIVPPSIDYYDSTARADLVISRAGGGVIADLLHLSASAILWPLAGHDEQHQNAKRLAATRVRTYVCTEVECMDDLVRNAINNLPLTKSTAATDERFIDTAARLVDYLLMHNDLINDAETEFD